MDSPKWSKRGFDRANGYLKSYISVVLSQSSYRIVSSPGVFSLWDLGLDLSGFVNKNVEIKALGRSAGCGADLDILTSGLVFSAREFDVQTPGGC